MKAVVLDRIGGPEGLRVRDVPRPVPRADDVVVRIAATGVCHHDVLDRSGKLAGAVPGRILGHEIAGEIVEVGPEATIPLGTRVVVFHRMFCGHCRYCLTGRQDLCRASGILGSDRDGGYAELVCVPSRNVVKVPDGLDLRTAALAVCPIGTSVRAVVTVANVRAGDRVLITGASGGLGIHQVQIAKHVGAWVIAVTSSPAKVEAIRDAGADVVVVATPSGFGAEVWRSTGKEGVTTVIDNVVSSSLGESLRCLAPGGLAVVLGNTQMTKVEVDPGSIIARRLRIAGSGNPTMDDALRSLQLLATGFVRPVVDRILPFPRAPEAHTAIEERSVQGRILLSGW